MSDDESKKRKRQAEEGGASTGKEGEKKGALYHCDYCKRDISEEVRIKDAVLDDFDLCLDCFSVGVELAGHKASNPYRVMDNMSVPLFDPEWGADEELLLLEGMEMYGLGNWADVAEHVGKKNRNQCEHHYLATYVNCPTAPLPDLARSLLGGNKPESPMKTEEPVAASSATTTTNTAAAADSGADGEIAEAAEAAEGGEAALGTSNGVSRGKPKGGNTKGTHSTGPTPAELAGYMPLRGEFDVEWENDAELMLADMDFREDEPQVDRDLKLEVLRIYNHKLDERERRKQFILERGLLDFRKQQALDRRRTKEERELYNSMRVFARFHTQEEHDAFLKGLVNELRLRKRIEQLKEYRANGIRTLAEGELYEKHKKKREMEKNLKKARESAAYLYENRSSVNSQRSNRWLNREKEEGGSAGGPSGAADGRRRGGGLNVEGQSGADLLDEKERQLCGILHLKPQQYMYIKNCLIRECLNKGFLNKDQARTLVKIDVTKVGQVYDFFVQAGWVNANEVPVVIPSTKKETEEQLEEQAAQDGKSAAASSAVEAASSSSQPQEAAVAVDMDTS